MILQESFSGNCFPSYRFFFFQNGSVEDIVYFLILYLFITHQHIHTHVHSQTHIKVLKDLTFRQVDLETVWMPKKLGWTCNITSTLKTKGLQVQNHRNERPREIRVPRKQAISKHCVFILFLEIFALEMPQLT